jgi:hypothetical protein
MATEMAESGIGVNSLLKKGTGSELANENPAKNDRREVPVPLFSTGC